MVPPDSRGITRVPRYSGTVFRKAGYLSSTGLSPSMVGLSRHLRLDTNFLTSRVAPKTAPQPRLYHYNWFGLLRVRSPLLAGSLLISLPAGTEMFHFPAFAPPDLCIRSGVTAHYHGRVTPFGILRIKACLAAPRSLSQLATSFIAFLRQGIHRTPLVA